MIAQFSKRLLIRLGFTLAARYERGVTVIEVLREFLHNSGLARRRKVQMR